MRSLPHPVLMFPANPEVLDLRHPRSGGDGRWPALETPWCIGRYDEDRGIYTQALFGGERTVHMGIDLGGPVGVAVHAPLDGEVIFGGQNPAAGDYGHALVTAHSFRDAPLYILFGHLSRASLPASPVGRRFCAGEVLGWLGNADENGGWPPHVHVQLALHRPVTHDLPGAVAPRDRERARALYPDPRWLLGPLY